MIKTWKERMPNGVAGHIGMSHETLCMHEEITELRTALEAAQKDAERYRWLKDNRSYHYSMQPDSPAEHGIEYQWQQGTYEERHQGLDGSIDAAIKAQEGKL